VDSRKDRQRKKRSGRRKASREKEDVKVPRKEKKDSHGVKQIGAFVPEWRRRNQANAWPEEKLLKGSVGRARF